MAAAFRQSRETLPEFLALARAPQATGNKLAVKIAIPNGDGNEYFWLTQFVQLGDRYTARISNTPRSAKQVQYGQVIVFTEAEIVDWLYMEGGKMRGNFTALQVVEAVRGEHLARLTLRRQAVTAKATAESAIVNLRRTLRHNCHRWISGGMMRSIVYAAGLLILLGGLWFLSGGYSGGTFVERAKRDEISKVAKDDPDMAAAFRRARDTLPEFLALARAPRSTIDHVAVKVGISGGDDSKEYFWISPFEPRDGKYSGRINNTPRLVKTVKFGQVIEFSEDEIVDWLFTEDGKMHGNFTACAILKREPPDQVEAMKKQYGLSCDS